MLIMGEFREKAFARHLHGFKTNVRKAFRANFKQQKRRRGASSSDNDRCGFS